MRRKNPAQEDRCPLRRLQHTNVCKKPAQEGKCPLRRPERTESPIDHLRDEDEEAKRPLVRLLGGVGTISPAFSSAALVIEGPNSS